MGMGTRATTRRERTHSGAVSFNAPTATIVTAYLTKAAGGSRKILHCSRPELTQLAEQRDLAEKKNRAYRSEVHQAAKDFWHLSSSRASEYAARRREELLKRAVDIDVGRGI